MRPDKSTHGEGSPPRGRATHPTYPSKHRATHPTDPSKHMDCEIEQASALTDQDWRQGDMPPLNLCYTESSTGDPYFDGGLGSGSDRQCLDEENGFLMSLDDEENMERRLERDDRSTYQTDDGEPSTTTRVLLGLDNILREKVNVEVDDFRRNIQSLLDEQLNRIQHFMNLSADYTPPLTQSQRSVEDQAGVEVIPSRSEEYVYEKKLVDEEDGLRNEQLMQLWLHAARITNTITQREEYHLHHHQPS